MNINLAKCPHCAKSISLGININGVDGYMAGQKRWHCVAYSCRSCNAVLSVQIDPIAIKTDTVKELKGR